jgi:ABC-type dipeptide/oligopeptide/nickel transport system permease component
MKRFLFSNLILIILITLTAMPARSQNPVKDYAANWKKVEAFQLKNLPQSALAEVKKIYALAKKENQDAQIIKSLVYMGDLQTDVREHAPELTIHEMEQEYTAGVGIREPARSILAGLLAGMYQEYYENNRWELMDRSETKSFKKEDIATWSAGDFHQKISELYLRSVKEEKLLQQTSLKDSSTSYAI